MPAAPPCAEQVLGHAVGMHDLPVSSSTTAGSGTASTTMRHSLSPPAVDWADDPARA